MWHAEIIVYAFNGQGHVKSRSGVVDPAQYPGVPWFSSGRDAQQVGRVRRMIRLRVVSAAVQDEANGSAWLDPDADGIEEHVFSIGHHADLDDVVICFSARGDYRFRLLDRGGFGRFDQDLPGVGVPVGNGDFHMVITGWSREDRIGYS